MAGLNNGAREYLFSELAKCRRFAHFRVSKQNNILRGERLRCTENVTRSLLHLLLWCWTLNVLCLYKVLTFILAMTMTVPVTFESPNVVNLHIFYGSNELINLWKHGTYYIISVTSILTFFAHTSKKHDRRYMLLESVLPFLVSKSGTCFQLCVSVNDDMYCHSV